MINLTPEEISAVNLTWSKIAENLKANSVKVFMSFFTAYPHHQKKFQRFASLPLDQLPENKRFQAHTFTAVSTLNSLLTTLDDEEVFDEMVRKVGENHLKRHGVIQEDFVDFMRILTELMENSVGDELWTNYAKSGWDKVSSVIARSVSEM